jgi:hypothetical protein
MIPGPMIPWLLIPMMALWANLHGGFIVGIVTIGVYTVVVAAQDLTGGKGFARVIGLVLLTAAAALATFITPLGVGSWNPVIRALRNPRTHIVIADWLPLMHVLRDHWGHDFGVTYVVVVGMTVAFGLSFAMTPRGGDLPLVAIAATMIVATMAAVRNLPLAIIACTLPIARHSALLLARRRGRRELAAQPARNSAEFAMQQVIAIAIAVGAAVYAGVASPRLRTDRAYPEGAVAFMRRNNLEGNVLNDFAWGEYLIWHLGPGSKVFIDGRYDTVFSDQVIEDYIDFHFDLQRRGVLSSYAHDFVLIPPASKAYDLMKKAGGWRIVYRDPDAVLFARGGSRTTDPAGVPIVGRAQPRYFP